MVTRPPSTRPAAEPARCGEPSLESLSPSLEVKSGCAVREQRSPASPMPQPEGLPQLSGRSSGVTGSGRILLPVKSRHVGLSREDSRCQWKSSRRVSQARPQTGGDFSLGRYAAPYDSRGSSTLPRSTSRNIPANGGAASPPVFETMAMDGREEPDLVGEPRRKRAERNEVLCLCHETDVLLQFLRRICSTGTAP